VLEHDEEAAVGLARTLPLRLRQRHNGRVRAERPRRGARQCYGPEPVEKRSREEEEEGMPFDESFAHLSETQLAYLTDDLKAVDKDTYEIKMNEKTKQICKIGPKGRTLFSPLLLTMLIAQGVVRMPEAK
jgi:hypothetical protein